jgi:hypothetical protein
MPNLRDFMVSIVTITVIALGACAYDLYLGPPPAAITMAHLLAAAVFGLCAGFAMACASARRAIDPWSMQARLMRLSGQPAPCSVQINKHTVTYLALCMEELSETASAVSAPLAKQWGVRGITMPFAGVGSGLSDDDRRLLVARLEESARWLSKSSAVLRHGAERILDDFALNLNGADAEELADATTDLSVTSCGLSVASGVPGAPCYSEIVESNLSKANPSTGVIDRDMTGKWIKGADYNPPCLGVVLAKRAGNP